MAISEIDIMIYPPSEKRTLGELAFQNEEILKRNTRHYRTKVVKIDYITAPVDARELLAKAAPERTDYIITKDIINDGYNFKPANPKIIEGVAIIPVDKY
jgi:serine protease inhibitor